ncbi:MAG TPA: hypothetical protein VHD83_26295 [Puia sp.]|nr:hypothetical protein [Puia sp.]
MNTAKSFPLALDFEGKHYLGSITPSEDVTRNGMPVYFRVTLGDTFFAYLCCSDHGWKDRDKGGHPGDLVQAIGAYIADYYE